MPTPEKRDPIEGIHLEPLWRLATQLEHLIRKRLWIKVVIGLVIGVAVGLMLGPTAGFVDPATASTIVNWCALPGHLFLALVQMIVVPLIFASIIRGLSASENMQQLRSMGWRAAIYFVSTTTVAIIIGLGVTLIIQPGQYVDASQVDVVAQARVPAGAELPNLASMPEVLIGLIPSNPLASMVGAEMLQVILFAVVMGVALVTLPGDKSRPLFDLLGSLQEVCMTVVRWAMRLAPLAVFGLIAQLTSRVGWDVLKGMGAYVLTVLLGLFVLMLLYLLVASTVGRRSPGTFMAKSRALQLLAFSTSSSAAVMPLSMQTAEEELNVHPSVARFLIPLGATINMDGTALYQGVATVFLAQVFQVPLDSGSLLLVIVTAVAASIGSPATPGVGIVILATVLESVGIPAAGVALILGVDRILDMCRTAVNVTGDLTACTVMDRWVDPQSAPSSG